MKITKITVGGFKNLRKTTIFPDHMLALVGFNNYGKSNVFAAISTGIAFMKRGSNWKKRAMANPENIPLNINMLGERFSFELTMAFEKNETDVKQFSEAIYGYEFSWEKNNAKEKGTKICNEYLKIKSAGEHKKYEQYIKRDVDKAHYKTSVTGRCDKEIAIDDQELIVNKLTAYDELFYLSVIRKILDVAFVWERHLDATYTFMTSPLIFKEVDELEIDAGDLPSVLASLKEKHNSEYELVKDAFLELFPEIKRLDIISRNFELDNKIKKIPDDIPFKLRNIEHRVFVSYKNINQPLDMSMMSDGTRRILMLLTRAVIAKIRKVNILAIEEPENSIQPLLLQKLLRSIDELSGDTDIFYASHSPNIIQYLDLEKIYFGIPNKEDCAEFERIPTDTLRNRILKEVAKYDKSLGDFCLELLNEIAKEPEKRNEYFRR